MTRSPMMVRLLLLAFLLSIGCYHVTAEETSPQKPTYDDQAEDDKQPAAGPDNQDDLAAIRQSADEFVKAFNNQKPQALAALWTEDGDYIDESGRVFVGRKAIAQEYAQFFKEHDGVKLRLMIDSLRLLSDDAAIEDGRAVLDPMPAGAPAISKYTTVHVKIDGKWLMSTVRDVRIETPSAYHNLENLSWLIGKWTAEEHGSQAEITCRWIANKSFIERRYTVTNPDQVTESSVEIIGYNPQTGQIQSWNFHSDGGHAVGVWTPHESGWQAEVQGTTADGTPTSAVNVLTQLDDKAFAWHSVQRSVGDTPLADTGEVVLRRVPQE